MLANATGNGSFNGNSYCCCPRLPYQEWVDEQMLFLWQRTNRKCKKMPYIHSIDKKLNQETRKAACCETFLCSNNIYIFSKRDKRYLVDLSCLHKFYSRVGLFSGISGNSYKESIAGIIHDH